MVEEHQYLPSPEEVEGEEHHRLCLQEGEEAAAGRGPWHHLAAEEGS